MSRYLNYIFDVDCNILWPHSGVTSYDYKNDFSSSKNLAFSQSEDNIVEPSNNYISLNKLLKYQNFLQHRAHKLLWLRIMLEFSI